MNNHFENNDSATLIHPMLTFALIVLQIIGGFHALFCPLAGAVGLADLSENRRRNPHDFDLPLCLMFCASCVTLILCPILTIVAFVYSWSAFREGQTGIAFSLAAAPLGVIVAVFVTMFFAGFFFGLLELITDGIRQRLRRWRHPNEAV